MAETTGKMNAVEPPRQLVIAPPQPGPMRTVSIVLLDDHRVVREGIAHSLEMHSELKIVGQCGDGLAAVEMIKALAPDFAILDLNHPGLHGLDVIRKLREANCLTKMVVLTMVRDGKTVREALRAGANGYLPKDCPARHLFDAINYIQDGGVYVSPLLHPNDNRPPKRGRPPRAQRAGAFIPPKAKLADAVAAHRRIQRHSITAGVCLSRWIHTA